ncbi:MAG: EVE domain-containing protein [Deltaproteobacteria bacterium]|nr:EVE domain-containing protein [Deltaproteobacteria bacterium]
MPPAKPSKSAPKPSKSPAKPSKKVAKPSKKVAKRPTKVTKAGGAKTPKVLGPVASLPPRAPGEVRYWLVKSEPDVFSIDDLARERTTSWEGVRNFQARNAMIEMRLGDLALYYHSNAEPSGVAGICEIVKLAYPDPTQFDPKSEYFDAGSKPEDPRWKMVDVGFVEKLARTISLDALKAEKALEGMVILQKGTRLSVTPVSKAHFDHVRAMGAR